MCPVLFLSVIGSLLLLVVELVSSFTVSYDPSVVNVKEGELQRINFTIQSDIRIDGSPLPSNYVEYEFSLADEEIATIKGDRKFIFRNDDIIGGNMSNGFLILGKFMGQTGVSVHEARNRTASESQDLQVIVRRKMSTISTIFTYSVAILVSLNYINMGCALDLRAVGSVLRNPVAPIVGLVSQYVIMPVMAFLLGLWLLSEATHLRLGLFIFGCSPAGGASNMWTVLLNGNLDLSITMTFVSTLLATGEWNILFYHLHCCLFYDGETHDPIP